LLPLSLGVTDFYMNSHYDPDFWFNFILKFIFRQKFIEIAPIPNPNIYEEKIINPAGAAFSRDDFCPGSRA